MRSLLAALLLSGCATDQYSYCLANRMAETCGAWVIDMPKRPLMEAKSGYLGIVRMSEVQ